MNYKALVIGTLSQDSFVSVNKKLAKQLGFVEAGLLSELIFTYKGVRENKAFFDEGKQGEWFYLTQAKVEEQLGLKRREHENAVKNLAAASVIFKKKMGLPAKSYYLINWEKIGELLSEEAPEPAPQSDCTKRTNKDGRNVQTGLDETYKQDSTECTTIHINKKKLEEKEIKNIKNKNLVNKGFKNDVANYYPRGEMLEIANAYYAEFTIGRWTKKQWFALTDKMVEDISNSGVAINNLSAYIYGALKAIAYKHDLKNGKVEFKYENENGNVPFYNWLDKWEGEEIWE